jgi:alpha-galactosidase
MPPRSPSFFGIPCAVVAVSCSTIGHATCTCGQPGPSAIASADEDPTTRSGWLWSLAVSGGCLTVRSTQASPADHTPVILAPCDGSQRQAATFDGDAIVFQGKCLDLPGFQTSPGSSLAVFQCNGGTNQRFTWGSDGTLRVLGMCVNAIGTEERHAQVVVQPCTGGPEQRIGRVPLRLP